MVVYTTPSVMAKVWQLLKDMELTGILTGESLQLSADKLISALFEERKLVQFLQIITKSDADFELELSEIGDIIRDFFVNTTAGFLKLGSGAFKVAAPEQSKD